MTETCLMFTFPPKYIEYERLFVENVRDDISYKHFDLIGCGTLNSGLIEDYMTHFNLFMILNRGNDCNYEYPLEIINNRAKKLKLDVVRVNIMWYWKQGKLSDIKDILEKKIVFHIGKTGF